MHGLHHARHAHRDRRQELRVQLRLREMRASVAIQRSRVGRAIVNLVTLGIMASPIAGIIAIVFH